MNKNIKNVLEKIVDQFKNGNIPEAISYAMFPVADTPSSKWSLLNRTIMFLSGTADARGFRQWKNAKRCVVKGGKAFYILVPFIKKIEEENGKEKEVLTGFKCQPVFRVEDTEGEPLDYEQLEIPNLPLLDKASEWGIAVKAIPGNYRYYGYYSSSKKEICLATPDESTFFHELAHAAHEKVNNGLKKGQDPFQEIVAELAAQALCKMVGKSADDTIGNSYQYIERYAEKMKLSAHSACLKTLQETEKVLSLILSGDPQKGPSNQ